ncbi:MAG: amino acid permease, partial [Mycobacteriaceae bacterium]
MPEGHDQLDEDEALLARLGYNQELHRSWSGFSNFAISFSIISILAGCFTSFGLG